MKISALALSFGVLCSSLIVLPEASAQFGGGGGVFGGGRSSGRGSRGNDSQKGISPSRNERQGTPAEAGGYEQIEFRLALLEEDLKLTPAQDAAWQSFSEKVRAYASDIARERARAMRSQSAEVNPGSGLQHLGQTVDTARNRLAALEVVEVAAKGLYQTLTPEQKSLADTRIPTIVAPRPIVNPNPGGSRLPDIAPPSSLGR